MHQRAYGPARVVPGRETRALRLLVATHPDDPDLDRLLAARALADAELEGVRRSGWRSLQDRRTSTAAGWEWV